MQVEKLSLELNLAKIKSSLDWDRAPDPARDWWHSLEELNQDRMHLVLKLARELKRRNVTIEDFFTVWMHSNLDDVRANLEYLDVLMQDKEREVEEPRAQRTAPFRKVRKERIYH